LWQPAQEFFLSQTPELTAMADVVIDLEQFRNTQPGDSSRPWLELTTIYDQVEMHSIQRPSSILSRR